MRNVCLLTAALVAASTTVAPAAREIPAAPVSDNPLIAPWTGPYGGVPRWDKLEPGRFAGAFELAMAEERREIEAIVSNPEAPTFENTIAAMERAGGMRERLEMLFDVTRQNLSTPEHQAVEREWRPRLSAAADAIVFNAGLFGRIEAVYRSLPSSRLEPDQKRLVTRIYEQYLRRGATLDQTQKGALSQINQEIAKLLAEFRARLLGDENNWTVLDTEADLSGLPSSLVATSKAGADERKLTGKWVMVNTRSSVDPFLTFSTRRDPSKSAVSRPNLIYTTAGIVPQGPPKLGGWPAREPARRLMRPRSVDEFLAKSRIPYTTFRHPPAYTAMHGAAVSHVPGRSWAKTVVCFADAEPILAVVPAHYSIDLERLRILAGAETLRLAQPQELVTLYPDCEEGAMPPFGELYVQRVFADECLVGEPEMVFNAGTHIDCVQMHYGDFVLIAHPVVGRFGRPRHAKPES